MFPSSTSCGNHVAWLRQRCPSSRDLCNLLLLYFDDHLSVYSIHIAENLHQGRTPTFGWPENLLDPNLYSQYNAVDDTVRPYYTLGSSSHMSESSQNILTLLFSGCTVSRTYFPLKWRQPKWVPAILDSEQWHQEAVHAEDDRCPNDSCHLLSSRVFHARHFES